MDNNEIKNAAFRDQLVNILVVITVALLMIAAIGYFYQNEPDYQRQTMRLYASTYANNARQANAIWQVEGKPVRVMLVQYDRQQKEIDRAPVPMGRKGWPAGEANDQGCQRLWRVLLGKPLNVENFKIFAEFIEAEKSGNEKSTLCRYKLSTGPYFDYYQDNGQVDIENL